MKRELIAALWLLAPLLMTGLALYAGPLLDFTPDLNRDEHFVPDVMWHDRQRIEQILLLILAAVAAATLWRKSVLDAFAALPATMRWSLGLGFALGALSMVLSAYPRHAGLEWATFLLLFGLAFLLAGQALQGGKRLDRLTVWVVVVAVAALIALKVMMGYLFIMIFGGEVDTSSLFVFMFSNRRVFGQVASLVIPLLAYPLLIGDVMRSRRWGVVLLLAVWWMLALASGTRGTWFGLAVAAVILVVFAWRACAGWLRVQIVALSAGALLFLVLLVWLPGWQSSALLPLPQSAAPVTLAQSAVVENRLPAMLALNGRDELWALAWTQIQSHPWLGIGPMHLAVNPIKYGAHPHNAVLQLAAEWGVPAALALLMPVMAGLLALLMRLRRQVTASPLLVCLTASLLAAGTQSIVDGVIVIPYTQTWLVLVAGWTLGVYFRDAVAPSPAARVARMQHVSAMAVCLSALLLLMNGVLPEAFHRVEKTWAYVDAGNRHFNPRYWLVGRIP